jgi:hypothetical protein
VPFSFSALAPNFSSPSKVTNRKQQQAAATATANALNLLLPFHPAFHFSTLNPTDVDHIF